MSTVILLDTGPWVVEQFRRFPPPFHTCEAVVAETCFLLARSGFDPSLALQFIQRGAVQVPFALQEQITASAACSSVTATCQRPWLMPCWCS